TLQNPILLAPSNPNDRTSEFCANEWISCRRITRIKESSIPAGGIGTFDYTIETGNREGYVSEDLGIVQESVRWFDSKYTKWVKLNQPVYSWSYVGNKFFVDSTKTQQISPTTLNKNQR